MGGDREGAAVEIRDLMSAFYANSQRQRGRRPVQLLVEEVPPPADRLHHEEPGRNDVRPTEEALLSKPDEDRARERAGDDAARHAEACEPGERVAAAGLSDDRQDRGERVVLLEVSL